ncbi:unnamed protein product [Linum trigynum]|uniref:Uncharacterized protein n=1 Tax=Linum trigynum TaxID=586398 RepID=A0AAV2CK93_9ROSI
MAKKFCYKAKVVVSTSIIVLLHCAAEVLEITENKPEANLIHETGNSSPKVKSLNKSIKTLKSCERVLPLAETLSILELH